MLRMRNYRKFFYLPRAFISMYYNRNITLPIMPNLKSEKRHSQSSQFIHNKQLSDFLPPKLNGENFISGENYNQDFLDEEEENENDKLDKEENKSSFKPRFQERQNLGKVLNHIITTLNQETVVSNISQLRITLQTVNAPLSSYVRRSDFCHFLFQIQKIYPALPAYKLIRIFHNMILMGFTNNKYCKTYVTTLLETLFYHLNDLPLLELMNLYSSLKRISNLDEIAKPIACYLPLLIEKHLERDTLSQLRLSTLFSLCGFCVDARIKNSYIVFEEIGENALKPHSCLSVLWNILDLPFFSPLFKFIIPPEKELIIEILAKECFAIIVKNIKIYTPDALLKTMNKMSYVSKKKTDIVYHEYFLQEVSKRAIEENWNITQLFDVAIRQYRSNYVNEDLLYRISEELPLKTKMDFKHLELYFPFSTMDAPPGNLDYFINNIEKQTYNSWKPQPYNLFLAACIWSLGYIPKALLMQLFNPAFFHSILIDPRTKQNWKKCLLFLNFMMERDSSLRHLCLSSKNKAIIIDSLHFKDTSDTDHDPSNLENIFENSSYYLDQILYGQGIFIDKLLVIDQNGLPVLLHEKEDSNQKLDNILNIYEDFSIDKNHKKIAILNITEKSYIKPEQKLKGDLRMKIKVLELEGFFVLPCFYTEDVYQQEEQLKKSLQGLGVKL